jgi:hypothetical protein
MSKPLTPRNREDKGELDRKLRDCSKQNRTAVFPSYFAIFSNFLQFLLNHASARLKERSIRAKRKIPLAAANMAIV